MEDNSDQLFKLAEIAKTRALHWTGIATTRNIPSHHSPPRAIDPPQLKDSKISPSPKTDDYDELSPKQQEALQVAVMEYAHQKEEAMNNLKARLKILGVDVQEKAKQNEEIQKIAGRRSI